MPNLRAIVTMPYLSGKPEDVAVNVLHFSSASADDAAAEVIKAHIVELYTSTPPVGPSGVPLNPLSFFLSSALSRVVNACSVKVYDLGEPEPRVPITKFWTLGAADAANRPELPAEVALCGTIWGEANRPRTRGRIYFGPFHQGASEDDVPFQRSRPTTILREIIGSGLRRLIQKPVNTQNLGILSRGRYQLNGVALPEVAPSLVVATNGWVDDAWDVQRRRGQDATLRWAF